MKRSVRAWLGRDGAPTAVTTTEPAAVINDLCFWIADDTCETFLPLQNYFSVFFPDLPTDTDGSVTLYDPAGKRLGEHPFRVPAHGLVRLRVREMLHALSVASPATYGALLCNVHIPPAVVDALGAGQVRYFWDRFYIGYLSTGGHPCFVHGVDKTSVSTAGRPGGQPFYESGKRYAWVPEMPVDLRQYRQLAVIVLNRTVADAEMTLTVSDARDRARTWTACVAPFGTHRFVLDASTVADLQHDDLRLRLDGMPTRWGRPIVFKYFANGAVSAMHC
jgi:hypothetical protein